MTESIESEGVGVEGSIKLGVEGEGEIAVEGFVENAKPPIFHSP